MSSKAILLIALSAISLPALGSEVLFNVESSKRSGASAISFDIVSNGDVAGFNFSVDLGPSSSKKIDTSSCISDIPKGFTGGCQFANGKLNVIAYSESPGNLIPKGVSSIGFVLVQGLKSSIKISNLELSNDRGEKIEVQSKIAGSDGSTK